MGTDSKPVQNKQAARSAERVMVFFLQGRKELGGTEGKENTPALRRCVHSVFRVIVTLYLIRILSPVSAFQRVWAPISGNTVFRGRFS